MKYAVLSLLIYCHFALSSIGSAELQDATAEAITHTHFAAIVKHTAVERKSFENHTQLLYSADVLMPIRGARLETIQYVIVGESDEASYVDPNPVLITLCRGQDRYYWPGTGASFPATEELVAVAKLAAEKAQPNQSHYPDCQF